MKNDIFSTRPGVLALVAVPFATILLAVGCQDNPALVNLDTSPAATADESALDQAPVAPVALADGIRENFGPRLGVSTRVVGDLRPHSAVVVQLEATANAEVAGGIVEVRLPTMAAMEYAGLDKRLRYPVGSKIPIVGSWVVPRMTPGQTWKQSVSFRLPEKGYYNVAVDITARGDGPLDHDPDFADRSNAHFWILASEAGGRVTQDFDAEVFPDRIVPQPGPFRARPGWLSASSSPLVGPDISRDAQATSSQLVFVEAVYYHEGQYHPAVGSRANALLFSQEDTTNERHDVPTNGIVSFRCPGRQQWLEGAYTLPGSRYAHGSATDAYFSASPSNCGDTIQLVGSGVYYLYWSYLNEVIPRINAHFGFSRSAVEWRIIRGDTYYRWGPFVDRIEFTATVILKSRAAHEYVHALHHKSMGGLWRAGNCDPHITDKPSSYSCAYQEGVADYGAAVGARHRTWEGVDWVDSVPSNRDLGEIEGNVAGLFWDLIDNNNEANDRTTYPSHYVFSVFKTCRLRYARPYTSWKGVPSFVWCLENRVDRAVHRSKFPGAPAPWSPTSLSERAREPSNWNADDIRSTWLQNLGR